MKVKIFIMISFFSLFLSAQNNFKEEFYIQTKDSLLIATSSWNVASIHKNKAIFERFLDANKEDFLSMYYVAFANFNLCTMKEVPSNREALIESAIKYLEDINKKHPDFEDSQILLSSILTYKMSYNRNEVIKLSQKSSKALSIAKSINENNPRLYYVTAVSKYYTPKAYGGGQEISIKLFERSISLFKNYKIDDGKMPDWGLAECYHWLGFIYKNSNQKEKAIKYFQKALEENPNLITSRYLLSEMTKENI